MLRAIHFKAKRFINESIYSFFPSVVRFIYDSIKYVHYLLFCNKNGILCHETRENAISPVN